MVTMRWAVRSIGFVSTVVLARLLTPADFGVVAMGTIVIALLDTFTSLGTTQLLIRIENPDREHFDTAWTISLIQSFLLAAILLVIAPLAAGYFDEPRVVAVIQIVALTQIVGGFRNVATVEFRRQLDFGSDFKLGVYEKVSRAIPTIALALYLRNYWALVAGMVVGQIAKVAIGYCMRPYRPRLCLKAWREFSSYAVWMTPANIAYFLNRKVDVFVVGSIASTAQMGAYNVASELSMMATGEIIGPMARAIYPNYARLKNHRDELQRAFLVVVKTVAMIAFSFGLGLSVVAEDVVNIVLGDQWLFAIPLVQWLAVFAAFSALQSTLASHVFIVQSAEHVVFLLAWTRLAVYASSVILAARFGDVQDVAIAATISTGLATLIPIYALWKVLGISVNGLLRALGRPMLAALSMFLTVRYFHADGVDSHFVTLALDVMVGAATFAALIFSSWILMGKPSGPEEMITGFIRRRVRSWRAS